MKTFRDASGTDWTVFEVRRNVDAQNDWSYLPTRFSDGWLCFESATAKKRLTRYPEHWREFDAGELERLLGDALPAPRTPQRLGDDLSSGDQASPPDTRTD